MPGTKHHRCANVLPGKWNAKQALVAGHGKRCRRNSYGELAGCNAPSQQQLQVSRIERQPRDAAAGDRKVENTKPSPAGVSFVRKPEFVPRISGTRAAMVG